MIKDLLSQLGSAVPKGTDGARLNSRRGLLMAKTPSSNVARKPSSKAKSSKKSAVGRISRSFARNRARQPGWTKIAFANAPMASGSRRAGRMAENSRIGSAPITSFSARLGNAAYGAPAELTQRPGPGVNPMSDCRQPRRDAGIEAFSISRPDLANGASPRGNAPRLARFRSDSAAAIWRRRLFRAMTAAPVVSLPLRTSACASVPATGLTRSACLRSPIGAK